VAGVRWILAGALFLALLASAAPAHAIRGDPYPGFDYSPTWSPDASAVAFVRSSGTVGDPHRLWVMRSDGTAARPLAAPVGTFSPDWGWVLASSSLPAPTEGVELRLVRPEGQEERRLGRANVGRVSWSLDGTRIAYAAWTPAGATPALVVQDVVTGADRVVTVDARSPVWSPDGRKLAFEHVRSPLGGPPELGVVDLDSGERRLLPPPVASGWGNWATTYNIAWSPDSRRLAIPRGGDLPSVWLVGVDDGSRRRLSLAEPVGELQWPSPNTLIGASDGVYRIDTRTGRTLRLTRFGASPDVSYEGGDVVFAGAPFCAGGIYRVASAGGRPVRLSPDCRIVGTARADVLVGTQYSDVLVGGDGNDELRAFDDWYYEGDRLEGGPGDDTLVGGSGTDVLRGGPGRDRFDGVGAADVIDAVDGHRDVVACGTQRGDLERDVASVDVVDVVDADCEHVFYPGRYVRPDRTSLVIRVWRGAQAVRGRTTLDPARTWRLSCAPPRGTLPHAPAVCDRIARAGNVFAPIGPEADCPKVAARLGYARVSGSFRGRRVTSVLRRRDGCELALWRRLGIPDVF
jgi:RTX calcium-binding nonapeptide repeat (4 copies)/WD40-like Beta Propeller Repeat